MMTPVGVTERNVEPQFILIHYDIRKSAVRSKILKLFRKLGVRMLTESVYLGLNSPELKEELKQIGNSHTAHISLEIVEPWLPFDQATKWKNDYEQWFVQDFVQLGQNLDTIDKMLTDEVLYEDKEKDEKRPFTADQITQRIRGQEYILRDLEQSVAKRKLRDLGKSETFEKNIEYIESLMKSHSARIGTQHASTAKRRIREGGQSK